MKRQPIDSESIVQAVLSSKKYGAIAPAFVANICTLELPKAHGADDAVKRVKRKLHQMVGAYLDADMPFSNWLDRLRNSRGGDRSVLCREILKYHSSTRERLPYLVDFYKAVFDGVPAPSIVSDLACGLNALARPFMPLPHTTLYQGTDVHRGLLDFVDGALRVLGYPVEVQCTDLLYGQQVITADVILLLKTLPCLEQAQRGITTRLLARLHAPVIIVSYPTASLGGGRCGMERFYEEHFFRVVDTAGFEVQVCRFETELILKLRRKP